ncbi:MAG: ribbon-helix-helix protein, CopG family [Candidatus Eremiobacteraeota bacterium]|nr:ribbon-helix-helix protein, CopG family [Candidatus Eremiobacteraeota bacterium]
MATIKTAISIEKDLFTRVEELAQVMHVSRSKVFQEALLAYLEKYENQQLLAELNRAYADSTTTAEQDWLHNTSIHHTKIVKDQW